MATSCADSEEMRADEEPVMLSILCVGGPFSYYVPSFPAFTARVRCMKFEGFEGDKKAIYHGLIRDCSQVNRMYPALAIIKSGIPNGFFVEKSEASKAINLESAKLLQEGMFVMWHWEWADKVLDESSVNESSVDECSDNEPLDNAGAIPDTHQVARHATSFKCIGASRDPESQRVLAVAAKRQREGNIIEVVLHPEPQNKYDAKAIAFAIKQDDEWRRVGYVVREALDSVHDALKNNEIVKVELKCIKYLLHWSRSGPGWYAAIDITKISRWSTVVEQHKSTM